MKNMKKKGHLGLLAVVFVGCLGPVRAQNGAPPIKWAGGGHYDVSGLDVSSTGTFLVTCSSIDETLKVWNAADGSFVRTLTTPIGGVNAVALSPDDSKVVSGGEVVFGGNVSAVLVWDVASGNVIQQLAPADNLVFSVAWSPNGGLVAAGDQANVIHVWNPATGQLVRTLTAPGFGGVFDLAFSPDSAKIVAGYGDNSVRVWNVGTGALLNTLNGHTFFVDSVAWSPDGARIASGSWDNTIRLWNASTGAFQQSLTGHSDIVRSLHFSPDSSKLASGSWDHSIRVWNASTGAPVSNFTVPDPGAVNAIRWTPDGSKLVSGGIGAGGFVLNATTGAVLATVGHHRGNLRAVALSANQARVVTGAGDFDCRVWDAAAGTDLGTFTGHADVINAIDLTADGTIAFSGSGSPPPDTIDVSIRIWSTLTTQQLHLLAGHPTGTTGVELTPDEQTIVSGGRDGTVKRWSASTGALQTSFASTVGAVTSMQLSPDGTRLAVAGNALRTINPATGAILQTFPVPGGNGVEALSWSSDSQRLLVGVGAYGNNLHLFDAATGGLVMTFAGDANGFIQGVALSPDGHTAACGSGYSRAIHTYFVDDGSLLKTWTQETGWGPFPTLPLAFTADGRLLFGRADATVVMAGCPGQVVAYGSGCAGSGGFIPSLGIQGCSSPGAALTLSLGQALGGAPVFLILGTGQGSIPLAGCTLLVDPLVQPVPFLATTLGGTGSGAGNLVLQFIVPPSFPPQTVTTQAWMIDPGAGQGWSASNGVMLTFQ